MFIEVLAYPDGVKDGDGGARIMIINTDHIIKVDHGGSFSSGPSCIVYFVNGTTLRVYDEISSSKADLDFINTLISLT